MLNETEKVEIKDNLAPEVYQLYVDGKLHGFDCLWIMGLAHEQQMRAAAKCISGDLRATYDDGRKHKGKGGAYYL